VTPRNGRNALKFRVSHVHSPRWKQQIPQKCRYPFTRLHGVKFQRRVIILTAVITYYESARITNPATELIKAYELSLMQHSNKTVGIAMGWTSRPVLGLHPASYPMGTNRGLFPQGGNRSGRKADHSPPLSAEVTKTRIYTSTPPYAFMA
jgi:hypothetical protein